MTNGKKKQVFKVPFEEMVQNRLREIGMTNKQLGLLIGKSESQVGRMLNGNSSMNIETIRTIITALKLDFYI